MAANSTLVKRFRKFFNELDAWIEVGCPASHEIFDPKVGICDNYECWFEERYEATVDDLAAVKKILDTRIKIWHRVYMGEEIQDNRLIFPFNYSMNDFLEECNKNTLYQNKLRLNFIHKQVGKAD